MTFGFCEPQTLARHGPLSYNAEMGTSEKSGGESELNSRIDSWLRDGGLIVAASERTRRALTARHHRTRRAEGLSAWTAPAILDWQLFLRSAWEDHTLLGAADDRLLLNSMQERSIWAEIAGREQRMATLLGGPRTRIASLAMQAHQLLCAYAPEYLREGARAGWQLDAGIFSGWLAEFEAICRSEGLLSAAGLPLELIARLDAADSSSDAHPARPSLLLVGFDRILPVQQRLLDAWGTWEHASSSESANEVRFYVAPDVQSELAACALWCRQNLSADPQARLLVITQDLSQRRGEIERVFLDLARADAATSTSPLFEFSLGIPLSKVTTAQSAHLLLRWLSHALDENQVDWLFSSGFAVADQTESTALQNYMRSLRRRGLERPQWSLQAFLSQPNIAALPTNWVNRITDAQRRLAEQSRAHKSPLDWAEFVPHLLQMIGWPGIRPLSSEEFQVVRRWQLALESCASLGFNGQRVPWTEFLTSLGEALEETVFAPESRDAPIQIAGPAESAGLTSDAVWFLGASESAWPASGSTHPLLPIDVQREAAMPHATSQLDWDHSNAIVTRLLSSAPQVCFSYARQSEDAEARPSRIITRVAGAAQALPPELAATAIPKPITVSYNDFTLIPLRPGKVEGGASVLTYQSQCPFKAFASARLAAQGWNPADSCLTAAQRGQLLHSVLHSIWGGPATGGIRTLGELKAKTNREAFIADHVSRAMLLQIKRPVRERLPHRYLEMEERRLKSLIGQWLEYELARVEFTVLQTEAGRTIEVAGLSFDLRLDRIDQLSDGTLLVIDYKTGYVTPKSWEPPRPDDVQLPLYASFAIKQDEALGGLTFAKVRRGDLNFAGLIRDARATIDPSLNGKSSLVKNKLDDETINEWKHEIEMLARDFLAGRADVNPREYPTTCARCGLAAVCRIHEHRIAVSENGTEAEAADE